MISPQNKSQQPTGAKPETTAPNEAAGPTDDKHSFNWGWVVWPLVVLLLYILSTGPLVMMNARKVSERKFSGFNSPIYKIEDTFYGPLGWAYRRTFLHKPLGMYFHLWAPKFFDKNGDPLPLLR